MVLIRGKIMLITCHSISNEIPLHFLNFFYALQIALLIKFIE